MAVLALGRPTHCLYPLKIEEVIYLSAMRRRNVKNDISVDSLFFQALTTQNSFSAGALPRKPLGELTTLPQTSSRLGRGTLPPHILPLSTPSVSRSRRLRRLGCQAPNTNSWLHLWPTHFYWPTAGLPNIVSINYIWAYPLRKPGAAPGTVEQCSCLLIFSD